MSIAPRSKFKVHTQAEKEAIVAEIQRRSSQEGLPIRPLAEAFGITPTTYYRWLRQGVRPASTPSLPNSSRKRFGVGERQALLVAKAEGLRAAGESIRGAAEAVGISEKSLRRWLAQESRPAFRPVAISDFPTSLALVPRPVATAPSPSELSLVAPGGYRIEGLGVESAAALLRLLECSAPSAR